MEKKLLKLWIESLRVLRVYIPDVEPEAGRIKSLIKWLEDYIEEMTTTKPELEKALEMEREIAGHLMIDDPHPQIWKELLEAQKHTDRLLREGKNER